MAYQFGSHNSGCFNFSLNSDAETLGVCNIILANNVRADWSFCSLVSGENSNSSGCCHIVTGNDAENNNCCNVVHGNKTKSSGYCNVTRGENSQVSGCCNILHGDDTLATGCCSVAAADGAKLYGSSCSVGLEKEVAAPHSVFCKCIDKRRINICCCPSAHQANLFGNIICPSSHIPASEGPSQEAMN